MIKSELNTLKTLTLLHFSMDSEPHWNNRKRNCRQCCQTLSIWRKYLLVSRILKIFIYKRMISVWIKKLKNFQKKQNTQSQIRPGSPQPANHDAIFYVDSLPRTVPCVEKNHTEHHLFTVPLTNQTEAISNNQIFLLHGELNYYFPFSSPLTLLFSPSKITHRCNVIIYLFIFIQFNVVLPIVCRLIMGYTMVYLVLVKNK